MKQYSQVVTIKYSDQKYLPLIISKILDILIRSHSDNGQPKQKDDKNCSINEEEEVELRPKSMRGRTKQRRAFDDTTLVQKRSNSNFMSYPTIELKGDLRGCIEKCRDLAGVGAAIVAHEGTDTKLGNLADLAGAVTDKIKELEVNLNS